MEVIVQMYFQTYFIIWHLEHFLWNWSYVSATGLHWWQVNIASGKWLGAATQQAITWANVDPDLCGHIASLGD